MRYICISCVLFSFQVLEGDPGGAEEEQEAEEEEGEEQGAAGADRPGRQRDIIAGGGGRGRRRRTGTRFTPFQFQTLYFLRVLNCPNGIELKHIQFKAENSVLNVRMDSSDPNTRSNCPDFAW